MPAITGLIHVCNHERQVGRALLSLRHCNEVLVIDHGSKDGTLRVAREHGARIIQAVAGLDYGAYVQKASHDWILWLLPCEAVAEDLEASLLEWKQSEPGPDVPGYNVEIREQNGTKWKLLPAEMRLVNCKKINWTNDCPPSAPDAPSLSGHLLRIPEN